MLILLVHFLVGLIIVGLIFWVVDKLLGLVPNLPAVVPLAVRILFVVIVVLLVVDFLLALIGSPGLGVWSSGHLLSGRC